MGADVVLSCDLSVERSLFSMLAKFYISIDDSILTKLVLLFHRLIVQTRILDTAAPGRTLSGK